MDGDRTQAVEVLPDRAKIKRVFALMVALAVLIVIGGVIRLGNAAFLKARLGDGMRTWETIDLLVLGPAAVIVLWLLFRTLDPRGDSPNAVVLIVGIFVIAAGSGMHTSTNFLHVQFRPFADVELARSIVHLDDELSHWVYFIGFTLISFAVAAGELDFPLETPMSWKTLIAPLAVGLSTAVVIYKNMVNEQTLLDIAVILATVVLIATRHLIKGSVSLRRLPVVLSIYLAFGLGSIATLAVWVIR